ncbi:MAG TPA: hypothetical protein VNI84_05920 [Pyrinomonadaceae bacterium]|nr:hypothetical protein [Pyrinomonadaceae bacterium]
MKIAESCEFTGFSIHQNQKVKALEARARLKDASESGQSAARTGVIRVICILKFALPIARFGIKPEMVTPTRNTAG